MIDSNIIVKQCNTLLLSVMLSDKKKFNKETMPLNDTLYKMDLTDDIHTEQTTQNQEKTHSSQLHMDHYPIDHMLGKKTSLNKFKKTDIMSSIFNNLNGMKLEVNYKGKKLEKKCGS